MAVEHKLKTWPNYWDAVARGEKSFEVRIDDRGYQKGDILALEKYEPGRGYIRENYGSGPVCTLRKVVTWISTGGRFGIEPGYVVLGLADAPPHSPTPKEG